HERKYRQEARSARPQACSGGCGAPQGHTKATKVDRWAQSRRQGEEALTPQQEHSKRGKHEVAKRCSRDRSFLVMMHHDQRGASSLFDSVVRASGPFRRQSNPGGFPRRLLTVSNIEETDDLDGPAG